MYPHQFWSLFPPFPRTFRVFVAMSFAPAFNARWEDVIRPAISSLARDIPLEPFRVDLSKKSDAILIEVLESIGSSLLIFGDITALHELDGRPVRNGNVMYELGLAHSARVPEEVILFRSDAYALDFDIAGVRVHTYDPDGNPAAARAEIQNRIIDALHAQTTAKRQSVELALQRLTLPALDLLSTVLTEGPVSHPATRTMGEALNAIKRSQAIELLLELGCIRARPAKLTAELLHNINEPNRIPPPLTYAGTAFGLAVMDHFRSEMGMNDPSIQKILLKIGAAPPPLKNPLA